MYDQNIGDLCSICSRRDYVPFECNKCKQKLCDDHYWDKQIHKCVINDKKNPHVPKDQKKHEHFCGQCKCKLYTVNHYYCNQCQVLYCLKHRLKEQHKCEDKKGGCQLI